MNARARTKVIVYNALRMAEEKAVDWFLEPKRGHMRTEMLVPKLCVHVVAG